MTTITLETNYMLHRYLKGLYLIGHNIGEVLWVVDGLLLLLLKVRRYRIEFMKISGNI